MRKNVIFILLAVFVLFFESCSEKNVAPKAKYVFLFIGDGMGENQVYATQLYLAAQKAKYGPEQLNFTKFPVKTCVTTYSANNLITDSAAAGTALASGKKTKSGTLNKDTTLTSNYVTIAESVKKDGYKVGILTTVGIDHATPAAFYAHQDKRYMYYNISMEMPSSGFDYFAGGGFHHPKGKDNDKPDAYKNLTEKGYRFVNTHEEFDALKKGDSKVYVQNPEEYKAGEFYWAIDKNEKALTLADITCKGIEVLDNDKGFFMMVEGGKIDWSCHANDAATTIQEVLGFNDAVAEAIKFYNEHPDETLIIVTADHETGGFTMNNKKYRYNLQLGLLEHQNISKQELTRTMVKFKNDNPKASFDDVLALLEKHLGLGNKDAGLEMDKEESDYLYEAYLKEFKDNKMENPDKDYLAESDYVNLVDRAIGLLNSKAGVSWSSHDHSGMPVPAYVLGQGQEYFNKELDNTDIPKIIAKVMSVNF